VAYRRWLPLSLGTVGREVLSPHVHNHIQLHTAVKYLITGAITAYTEKTKIIGFLFRWLKTT